MSINNILDSLISSTTTNLNILNGLIGQQGSETLLSSNPALYTAPTVDVNGLWTLAQSTPNTDNDEYLGIYTLPDTSLCSQISAVTVVSHSAPAAPNAPARVLPPGSDPLTGWVNLASVAALALQEFVTFAIRSTQAFQVTARVAACPTEWSHPFDFATEDGGFVHVPGTAYGVWQSGVGWVGTNVNGGQSVYIGRSFAQTTLTHVEVDGTFGVTGNYGVVADGVVLIDALDVSSGTRNWTGEMSTSGITLNPSSGLAQGGTASTSRLLLRGTGNNPF